MLPFVLFVVVLSGISSIHGLDHPDVDPSAFCYDDENCDFNTWPGFCKTGKEQSPININTPIFSFTMSQFMTNLLYTRLSTSHKFYGQNNGHTAQFEFTPNTSALESQLEIWGGGLGARYKFAQLHFHWGTNDSTGSEHTLNGKRYPMELHLVHYKSIYGSLSQALASDDRSAVAVMAVLYTIGTKDNANMDSIIQAASTLDEPGQVTEFNLPITISNLFPGILSRNFARYMGSLTTPTCDEKVIWTVFLTPVEISANQMNVFRKLRNHENVSAFNFRPIQALNARKVTFARSA